MATDKSYPVRNIPHLSIQHDWFDGIRNGEKIWFSCSIPGEKTEYCEFLHNTSKSEEVINGFQVHMITKKSLKLTHLASNVSVRFCAPSWTFQNIHKKAVRCLDISSGGALGISCGDDGQLNVWNTSDGIIRRTLEGHVSDVSHCRFFPSGIVALSGGADMRIKIWSVENGSCPRTMVGHKAGITDSAIIEKGRNIISCSRDGTARHWDCSSGQCVSVLTDAGSVINGCSLGIPNVDLGTRSNPESEGETGTEGKLLILAREDGVLEGRAVLSSSKVFHVQCKTSVNCCEFMNDMDVIGGCQNGNIYHYDVRNMSVPVSVMRIGNSSINHMKRYQNGMLFAKDNGSVMLFDPTKLEENNLIELIGPNADAVYRLGCYGKEVYTASRDAKIRKYSLDLAAESWPEK